MGINSFNIPIILEEGVRAVVRAGYFPSKSAVVNEALRELFNKNELRIATAMELYKEEKLSLGKAAEMAGITSIEFRELLIDSNFKRKIGPEKFRAGLEKSKELLQT